MTKRLALAAVLTSCVVIGACGAAPARAADDGAGKVVTLDEFFNHQVKNGKPYHYIWEDTASSGFSKWGDLIKTHGAQIAKLEHAPAAADLKKTSIYVIANPSIPENAADKKPNYIDEASIKNIAAWVNDGGVLVLLANDPGKCEFEHFNKLASQFGITFDANMRNTAPTSKDRPHATFLRERDHFPDHPIFKGLDTVYMKEITSITVKAPAEALFVVDKDPKESVKKDDGAGPDKDVIVATAKVGKGLVLAVGDPWIYNEYFAAPKDWDNHGGTTPWQNDKAAENITSWLLQNAQPPQSK